MKQPNTGADGSVVPYHQNIPDYTVGMDLPDEITVLYTRLSRDDKEKEKEDDSNSIVNQKKILARYAQEKRLTNPVFFTDDGISGTTFDRPDFQAAIALVDSGKVKNFVVKDMSRFGRDYIQVGIYTEVRFPDADVRFMAINDGVDSSAGENELTPFRNIMNEWYARDTSKKIRAVFRAKGLAGEHLSAFPVYGYKKDPKNEKQWIVDEEAAKVVQQIFTWCMEGLGPMHIAKRLQSARIEIPAVHAHHSGQRICGDLPDDPYDWLQQTVVKILARREYLGHTINFKTRRKSYKNKKKLENDPSEYAIFENTHPAIIEEEVFEKVQQIRAGKRRNNHSGRVSIFSGLIYCADCGSKMYLSSGACLKPEQDNYVCSGFRTKKRVCNSAHFIRRVVLEKVILKRIQDVTSLASKDKHKFLELLLQDSSDKCKKELALGRKQLTQSQNRVQELDQIIRRLYEDNVSGKLTDERFIKLSRDYEQEQKNLTTQVNALQTQLEKQETDRLNVDRFVRQIHKYTHVTELSAALLNELVERIEVHTREKRYEKKSSQQIDVHFNYVGDLEDLHSAEVNPNPAETK